MLRSGSQAGEFYNEGIERLVPRLDKCLNNGGDYGEKECARAEAVERRDMMRSVGQREQAYQIITMNKKKLTTSSKLIQYKTKCTYQNLSYHMNFGLCSNSDRKKCVLYSSE
ncbi:hypothetical protein ANN_15067 [Periplaneta americana]|uniref:Uncharacterized protein n=1 Tax=Periplaneta americana TaxID=6978 RepID=A0ABQ8T0A6_PERAM|nr:hypothetical protein ANN_15067 [Periplaneta americana]